MPLAEAVETTWWAWPATPGPNVRGAVRLAGALTAWAGTWVPSGRECGSAAAEASEPVVAIPAVHAAESRASGSSADAFCVRPNLAIDLPLEEQPGGVRRPRSSGVRRPPSSFTRSTAERGLRDAGF